MAKKEDTFRSGADCVAYGISVKIIFQKGKKIEIANAKCRAAGAGEGPGEVRAGGGPWSWGASTPPPRAAASLGCTAHLSQNLTDQGIPGWLRG